MLVVVTGLPGTGKSTVAGAVARSLPAALISADPIEDNLGAAVAYVLASLGPPSSVGTTLGAANADESAAGVPRR